MSVGDNINNNLDKQFENHAYLPQKLEPEDFDMGIWDYIKSLDISMVNENGVMMKVPVIWLTQELWAERKLNWKEMRNENGEEVTRPFMAMIRKGIKPGLSPLKRTIPNKKKFTWLKVPAFDGTLKGYYLYKIPQPTYIDLDYDLRLYSHYMVDVNTFYKGILADGYSDGQGYMTINGYPISSKIGDPNESNQLEDMSNEKIYVITVPIVVNGKLIDPTKFEKVNTITKISIKISEK